MSSEFFVEAVAYRQAAIEEIERRAFAVGARAQESDRECGWERVGCRTP